MTTTTQNTQAEIVAEAQTITGLERAVAEREKTLMVLQLRADSGLTYSTSVAKARYQLEIIDFSGKRVVVTNVSEPMPFYEFNEYLRNFQHSDKA